jgi:diguanylate cyclase (GGDEF)-like protein
MLHDITDRKEAEDSLEHLAKFDSLTDLPNRYLLLDRLEESMELARRSHQKLGIVSLDLDRFKGINDWLGHAGGDEMLQEVGRRLTQALRSTDTVARMGGDEFIILLESVERPEDVQVVCGKILRALQDPLSIQGQEIVPTCSIGYCLYPDHGSDRDVLLQRADAAMYEAKEGGRGQVRAYSEAFGTASSSSMKLEQDLRRAINSDEFLLAYQPQYELQSGNLSGMEALLRWNHPERGMVSPGEFMNLLEETGLILPVGKQVMQKAAEQVQRWRSAGLEPPRVSVNLSAKQFYNKDLLGDVEDCLKETGLTADCLEMELTETAVMRNMDVSARVLQKLKDRGVRIALDDFGKGYSTLHVLGRIPIDVVKIDSSFIQGVPSDKEKAALTEAIITMAHGLDKQVVAEGVEHAEQKQWLIRMECDHVQGFYFSYPLLPAYAERLLHPGCGSIACGREGMIPGTARRRIPGMQPGAAGA